MSAVHQLAFGAQCCSCRWWGVVWYMPDLVSLLVFGTECASSQLPTCLKLPPSIAVFSVV